jgi:hypothetical protein
VRKLPKKEEKTYSADVVRNHIDMYGEMIHLADNWHVAMSADTRKHFEDTIERVEKEFLDEFKDKGFYHYLSEMKKILER